ncbi:hypothetical protein ACLKA6_018987 [Drosophila palustris]
MLKVRMAGQEKLTNALVKDLEIQLLRADIQFIRGEQERQKNALLAVESEIKRQNRYVLDKEANIQGFRTNIQKNLDKKADIQSLRVDLEKQNKDVLQSLRGEVERLGKLVERLVKESDKHHNCAEAKSSGIYDILVPKFSSEPFKVACDAETRDGGWTIILRRIDGSVNFNRNWTEYKNGFGNLDGEYFLGLDKIHAMTAERRQELLVLLEDFEGDRRYETYDEFAIGNEDQQYELHTLGKANGTAGDSLDWHQGLKFSTFDKDNNKYKGVNCAISFSGAWWYRGGFYCYSSQLTGTYKENADEKGINWETFRGTELSLKTAIMMIRPKK